MSFAFTKKVSVPSFSTILIAATVLRVGLIAYSEWHDAHSVVKYTDVDYRVFSDAARFTLHADPLAGNVAQGPLGRYLQLGEYVMQGLSVNYRTNSDIQPVYEKDIPIYTTSRPPALPE